MPDITIDGTSITSCTIDGTPVTEITMDGSVIWTSGGGLTHYITGLFNMTSATTPAPMQVIDVSDENTGDEGWKAFNTVVGDYWSTPTGTADQATLDLGAIYLINQVEFETFHSSSKGNVTLTVYIEGSEDNSTWTEIGNKVIPSTQESQWRWNFINRGSLESDAISTRYLRFRYSASGRCDTKVRTFECNGWWG